MLYPFFGLLPSPIVAAAAVGFSSVSVVGNALRLRHAEVRKEAKGMYLVKFSRVVLVAMVAALAACASTSGSRTATAPARGHGPGMHGTGMMGQQGMGQQGTGMMGGRCPMQIPGTTVTSEDVTGGVALRFTTTPANVAALRQSVNNMASMHNSRSQGGRMGGMYGGGAGGGMMRGGGMMMPPSTAAVENIDNGALLVLRPQDPSQLGLLRERAQLQAGHMMARGGCPLMSPGAQGTSQPPAGT